MWKILDFKSIKRYTMNLIQLKLKIIIEIECDNHRKRFDMTALIASVVTFYQKKMRRARENTLLHEHFGFGIHFIMWEFD